MVHAALDGLGLAYVTDNAVREHLAEGRLVRVLDAFCVPFPGFFLYYPSRAQRSAPLQKFIETIRELGGRSAASLRDKRSR
jgi:DNA-binding transcriptional LysR family regulator